MHLTAPATPEEIFLHRGDAPSLADPDPPHKHGVSAADIGLHLCSLT